MIGRALRAVIAGLIAALIAAVVLAIVSALLPAVNISVMYWAAIVGLLYGLYTFFVGGEPIVRV